jgi:hypothetical protein
MPANNWNVWWQATNTPQTNEQEEFVRGIFGGGQPISKNDVIFSIIAGYVGGRIAQRTGNDK